MGPGVRLLGSSHQPVSSCLYDLLESSCFLYSTVLVWDLPRAESKKSIWVQVVSLGGEEGDEGLKK